MAYNVKQKLNSMRYKDFTWEYNPATCTYSCDRTYVAHKYPELSGVELEDMDVNQVIITGDGEFFGPNAYTNWMKLVAEYNKFGVGSFYHPVYTDVTRALMTKLQSKMEPREDYVAYSFEIVSDSPPPAINTPSVIPVSNGSNSGSGSSSSQIKVGDIVILTGYAYYDSYGKTPRSAYKNGVRYTVTRVNYKGTHPIHCGSLGWCTLSSVKLASESNNSQTTNDIIHTVKANETLSGICSRYGANWKSVASYNNLKNPHLIFPNQQIKIPQSMITKK